MRLQNSIDGQKECVFSNRREEGLVDEEFNRSFCENTGK